MGLSALFPLALLAFLHPIFGQSADNDFEHQPIIGDDSVVCRKLNGTDYFDFMEMLSGGINRWRIIDSASEMSTPPIYLATDLRLGHKAIACYVVYNVDFHDRAKCLSYSFLSNMSLLQAVLKYLWLGRVRFREFETTDHIMCVHDFVNITISCFFHTWNESYERVNRCNRCPTKYCPRELRDHCMDIMDSGALCANPPKFLLNRGLFSICMNGLLIWMIVLVTRTSFL